MAEANFHACMAFILGMEGGYVDDPADASGASNLGITAAALSSWRGAAVDREDVMKLTRDEAEAIYRTNYWNTTRCDDLPPGVDLMVLDGAVFLGSPSRSARILQTALGVLQDGSVGPATIVAAKESDPITTIERLAALRLEYVRSLPSFNIFGAGWTNRVSGVKNLALQMAKT